jgi:hypothetical protein
MDNALTVTDEQLNELRFQINEHKKRQEYERLKQDLHTITFQANHTLTEFDGGMKQVDTERVLFTNNQKKSFSEILIARFLKMCAVRPIVGNVIAVALAMISIFSLHGFLNNPELGSLKTYLGYFIELAAGVQILKSASRSLILPICAAVFGAIVANQLTGHHLFLQHSADFYQAVLVTGLIGIAISVFTID